MKKKLLILAFLLIVAVIAYGGYYILTHSGFDIDRNNLPKFIQASFIDVSKVYSISKFRSGAGHDFSGGGETCRSMKHYFAQQASATDPKNSKDAQGLPPKPDGKTDTSIFSPVDGTIVDVSEERTPIGSQVAVVADKQPEFRIRLFHIYLDGQHKAGTKVKAGEKIGVISAYQDTDISVQIGTLPWNENYVSYFDVLPDNLFQAYLNRGATSRNDFVLTKAYRDAHPLKCEKGGDESFIYPAGYDSETEDYVHLSGYLAPSYDTGTMKKN